MNDERLWDGEGAPDAELDELEALLRPHGWRGELPPAEALPARPARTLRRAWMLAAAAAALIAVGLLLSRSGAPRRAEIAYGYEVLAGSPRVEGGFTGMLRPGQRVVCDGEARVRVAIGAIGRVELGPDSSLRVEHPADARDPAAGHLLFLERGRLRANILAAPRLFQLGTPAGVAVDLGCEYEATVAHDGSVLLAVRTGQVAFERDGRRAVVPAGASTVAFPGHGPATPTWDDAGDAFRADLLRVDGEGDLAALERVLDAARVEDSLSLWHLLSHAERAVQERTFDRLAELCPPPPGVRRDDVLAGRDRSLELYKRALGWSW